MARWTPGRDRRTSEVDINKNPTCCAMDKDEEREHNTDIRISFTSADPPCIQQVVFPKDSNTDANLNLDFRRRSRECGKKKEMHSRVMHNMHSATRANVTHQAPHHIKRHAQQVTLIKCCTCTRPIKRPPPLFLVMRIEHPVLAVALALQPVAGRSGR
eukprot:6274207-Amphidinium_carterae.1